MIESQSQSGLDVGRGGEGEGVRGVFLVGWGVHVYVVCVCEFLQDAVCLMWVGDGWDGGGGRVFF